MPKVLSWWPGASAFDANLAAGGKWFVQMMDLVGSGVSTNF